MLAWKVGRLSVGRCFKFEIVAGRVKYSGPKSPRTTRLTPKFQTHRVEFPPELAGKRLDQALARLLPQYSRTRIQRWIEEGAVLVNGLAVRAARHRSSVAKPPRWRRALAGKSGVKAEKLPLDIVHQDASIIVLNKPPGLVVHPGAGNPEQTLQNALLAHDVETQARAARRARASHRQGHQRVVSRGAHAGGAHGAGRQSSARTRSSASTSPCAPAR